MRSPAFKFTSDSFSKAHEASDYFENLKSSEAAFSKVPGDSSQKSDEASEKNESNILPFPASSNDAQDIIGQREISRRAERAISQLEAFRRYKKTAQTIFVRSSLGNGAKKSRVASTQGILVDKKQA